MKSMIFSALMTMSSFAVAATCPQGTQIVHDCTSTPQSGDSLVVSDVYDSIAICSAGSAVKMVAQKGTNPSEVVDAESVVRAGGSSYTVTTPDIDITLSVTTGIMSREKSAKLILDMKKVGSNGLKESSTYTCK